MKKSKKRVQVVLYFVFFNLLLLLLIYRVHSGVVVLQISSDTPNASVSIYYANDNRFNEKQRTTTVQVGEMKTQIFTLDLVGISRHPNLRLDFNDLEATYYIKSVNYVTNPFFDLTLEGDRFFDYVDLLEKNSIASLDYLDGTLKIRSSDVDPFLVFNTSTFTLRPNLFGVLLMAILECLMLFTIRCAVYLTGKEGDFKRVTKQQKWLDLAKITSAYLVVALHVGAPFNSNVTLNYYVTQGVTRIAVPLFFVISGYLFFSKLYDPVTRRFQRNDAVLQKYCAHSLSLYFVWNIIYVFICPVGLEFSSLTAYFWDTLMGGGFWQLWYLLALPLGVFILYWILCSGLSPRAVSIAGGVFYLIGIVLDFGYLKIIKNIVPLANTVGLFQAYFPRGGANAVFFAIPMLTIGIWFVIHLDDFCLKSKSSHLWIAAVIFVFVVMPAEALFAKDRFSDGATNMWITLPIATFLLMAALLHRKECDLISSPTAHLMRSVSTIVYLIHPFFIESFLAIPLLNLNGSLRFFFVCISSTIFSLILIWLSGFIPVLKKLY